MANPDHLELLKQGTKAWNAWRRKHRSLRPDLSGDPVSDFEHDVGMLVAAVVNEVMPGRAPPDQDGLSGLDLASADLHGRDLHAVNLSRANLLSANLRGADLRGANLAGAILTDANLSKCDLRRATMNGAILRFAKLKGARLDGAMLRLCSLDRVDATRASLRDTDGSPRKRTLWKGGMFQPRREQWTRQRYELAQPPAIREQSRWFRSRRGVTIPRMGR